jgi:hypothetical protein
VGVGVVAVCVVDLLLCQYGRPGWMKTGYSHNPNINCLLLFLLSFEKKEKQVQIFLDVSLIRVAPEATIQEGLHVYIIALLAKIRTFRSDKGVREKRY